MSACDDQCPICKTSLADQCCETCGSLEGVDQDSFAASRVFGYDWAAGSVAPWRDAQGRAYATPAELAEVALAAAGLERGGYAIDLGCGDAAILRAAATRFGCRGLGLDIDDGALADAARAIEADGVGELISVRRGDLNEFDLAGEIDQANAPVVVTCYLLPATLRELRPKLEDACRRGATVVLFRWDCGLAWQGPEGRHDDRGFTVYCPGEGSDTDETEPDSELLDRLSPLIEVLGVEALQYLDTASLGCLNACARAFGKQSEATGRSPCEDEAYRRLRAHPKFRRHDGNMPEPSIHRPARGGGFPGWIYVLNDWERYWVFKARGEFRGYVGVPADAFSFRRIVYILGHANVTRCPPKYSQCRPSPDKVAWSRDYDRYVGWSDRLSMLVEVLDVNALRHMDATSLGRLSACAKAFGHKLERPCLPDAEGPDRWRSLCEDAACYRLRGDVYKRLHADKRFRESDAFVYTGQFPRFDSSVWGRDGLFSGWLHVLFDWEQALKFERCGGFNAFDLSDKLRHIEEMNSGAQSFRRWKRILGHLGGSMH